MHQNICLSCRVGHFHSFLPKADQNSVHFKSKPDNNSIMKLKRYPCSSELHYLQRSRMSYSYEATRRNISALFNSNADSFPKYERLWTITRQCSKARTSQDLSGFFSFIGRFSYRDAFAFYCPETKSSCSIDAH